MNKISLMSHLVANYPTPDASFEVARALVNGGADILEIQLPFSDPSADGPAIQGACSTVLQNGHSVKAGLEFIKRVRDAFPDKTIYLMSYASLVFTPGVDNFCKAASQAGVNGMIIPDLPFDNDEGLTLSCTKYGMDNIPVAAYGIQECRLKKMTEAGFRYIYAALRRGITGSKTDIDETTIDFIKHVRVGNIKVFGGFGIESISQAKTISPFVDAVVAGSVFVRLIAQYYDEHNLEPMKQQITAKARELCGM